MTMLTLPDSSYVADTLSTCELSNVRTCIVLGGLVNLAKSAFSSLGLRLGLRSGFLPTSRHQANDHPLIMLERYAQPVAK